MVGLLCGYFWRILEMRYLSCDDVVTDYGKVNEHYLIFL